MHVNLVDLLDCWDSDYTPTRFRGKKALAAYTEETHKFFGRDIAKQDKVLRVLLRKLLQGSLSSHGVPNSLLGASDGVERTLS